MSAVTAEFMRTLPKGPLVQHIGKIHTILVYGLVNHDPNAFAIAEHSLREIARVTALAPREELRRELVRRSELREGQPDMLRALKKAFMNFEVGLKNMRASMDAKRTPEQQEATAERRYRARLESERVTGLAFVKAEARRARAELRARGLNIDA